MNILKALFISILISVVVNSCTTFSKEKQIETIQNLEKELYSEQSPNRDKGIQLIDSYVNFSNQYSDDTVSAQFLFKAAEIGMNLQLGSQSINYYNEIINNYPNFYKTAECIFLKAFIYENQLNDLKNAEKFYSQFIAEYPNHPLAKDAEASIKYLGKSPEELVKMFQEQNEE